MIRILTDSASDILPAEAEQLGVTVIPLNVTLEDGTVLRDGVDMTPTVYYGVMARCHKLPTTSQPSPELFQRFFLEAAAAGDEVVGIFLSHELSGTCQCARLAADMANVVFGKNAVIFRMLKIGHAFICSVRIIPFCRTMFDV